jgi:hypothetical protein
MTSHLLDALRDRGVRIEADRDDLVIDAPKGELIPADLGAIRESKAEILDLLRAEEEARLWRDWLGDLLADGSVLRHLGAKAEAKARALLDSDHPSPSAMRSLVQSTMALVWPARYAAAGLPMPDSSTIWCPTSQRA